MQRRKFIAAMGAALAIPASQAKVANIEFGVCGDAAHFDAAVRYGFDYYEMEVAEIALMDNPKFAALKDKVLASPIRCMAFRSFIRRLVLVGETVAAHQAEIKDYLEQNLDRCQQLGGRVVVWGSSGSRNVPDGFSRDRAWQQIQEFLHLAGDIARKNNLIMAIEPLRKKESNIINSAGEALKLVREVNHPNVKMIVDYFHLREENEDPNIIRTAQKEIAHLHFANPTGRRWPHDASEDSVYPRFFALIKEIGYRGGLSIEGTGTFEDDADASLKFFKQMLTA